MTDSKEILLEGQGVTKVYSAGDREVPVLNDASFTFAKGSFTAIIGRSGTGKTTLLNLCGGIDRPDSGMITFEGRHLEHLPDAELATFRNEHVGYIFQSFFLRENRTALDNVMVPLLLGNHTIAGARARAEEALREVGLGELIKTRTAVLSGGQKQRVAIARAISNRPRLILADEPTGSLDTETSKEILELLFHYNRQKDATIIVVTHDPLVEKLGVPMITIEDGKILPVDPNYHLGAGAPNTDSATATPAS